MDDLIVFCTKNLEFSLAFVALVACARGKSYLLQAQLNLCNVLKHGRNKSAISRLISAHPRITS
jgi:hypothetical protein